MKQTVVQTRIDNLLDEANALMIGNHSLIARATIEGAEDEFDAELTGYSDAGENVVFTLSFDGSKEDFVSKVEDLADEFDPEEHALLWAQGASANGVPSLEELVTDAKDIDASLLALAEALACCLDKRKAAERRRINQGILRLSSKTRFQKCVQKLIERLSTEKIAEAYRPESFANNVLFLLQKEYMRDIGISKTEDKTFRILREHPNLVRNAVLCLYRDVSEDEAFWGSLPESANLIHLALEIVTMKEDGR